MPYTFHLLMTKLETTSNGQEEMERCGPVSAWGKEFNVNDETLRRRLENTRCILASNLDGHAIQCYPESIVAEHCGDLVQAKHIANKEGFFTKGGEKYGTLIAWVRSLPLSQPTVAARLEGAKSIFGRTINGRVRVFYTESEVKEKCGDLLRNDLLVANEEGFIIKDGKTYGTIPALAKKLQIRDGIIRNRLTDVESTEGKIKNGNVMPFYPEEIVRARCADFINGSLITADKKGFLEINGIVYGTISACANKLGISTTTVDRNLSGIKGVQGRNGSGNVFSFYPLEVIRQKCERLINEELPRCDENGFFKQGDELYGHITAWSSVLPISMKAVRIRLAGAPSIKAKTNGGHVMPFYSEKVVKERCANLLEELPIADETGLIIYEGKRHGTVSYWHKFFSLSHPTIRSRLTGVKALRGKRNGHLADFFEESAVRDVCADVLERK